MKTLDLHYHADPDLYVRRETALSAGALAGRLGCTLVLKSHLGSTVDTVLTAREAGHTNLLAALTLNATAGGADWRIIEREVGKYARRVSTPLLVYLPTIVPHKHKRRLSQAFAHPCLAGVAERTEPISDAGHLLPKVVDVIQYAADHQVRLATGHASKEEVLMIIDAAVSAGLKDLMITHATHPCVGFSPDELLSPTLFATGSTRIWIEQTALTYVTGAISLEDFGRICQTTPRLMLSSDLGQTATLGLDEWHADAERMRTVWGISDQRWQAIIYDHPAKFLGYHPGDHQ